MNDLTLVLIFKNEAPYLAEWLAFYQAQGVEHIVLYDHGSTDEWRDVLARFPEVTLRQALPFNQAQQTAYNEVLAECRTPWLAGLDIDEFLFWPGNLSCLPYLAGVDRRELAGLVVSWTQMHSTDEVRPEGLVIQNYRQRRVRAPRAGAIKPIICVAGTAGYLTSHRATAREGFTFQRVYPLQLNHYFTKSRAEFERKRSKGGPGLSAPGRTPDPVAASDYDRYNNEPTTPETRILALVPQTQARLAHV